MSDSDKSSSFSSDSSLSEDETDYRGKRYKEREDGESRKRKKRSHKRTQKKKKKRSRARSSRYVEEEKDYEKRAHDSHVPLHDDAPSGSSATENSSRNTKVSKGKSCQEMYLSHKYF